MLSINYFAILIAAAVGFAVGVVWYSPALFGRRRERLAGRGEMRGDRGIARAYVFEFIATLLLAYVLGQLVVILSAFTFFSSIVLAFWVWLGFQVPLMLSGVWFGQKPWQLFWIDALYRLVEVISMAVILGLWI